MPNVLRRISETWIVWTIVGVVVVFDAGAVVLGILDRHVQTLSATVMFSPTTIGFAAFGALIVWRHRAHSIGWLFVGVAFFFSLCHNLAQNYAVYALAVDPGSLPAGKAAFWLASTASATSSAGWAMRRSPRPRRRSAACSWTAQPGLAVATMSGSAARIARAFRSPSSRAARGWTRL